MLDFGMTSRVPFTGVLVLLFVGVDFEPLQIIFPVGDISSYVADLK